MNAPSRTLSRRAAELLDAPDEQRIDHIKKAVFIPYARAEGILREMTGLLSHPKSNRPPNFLIVGKSNNGKTEILKEFMARNPVQERPLADAIYAPAILVQAPPGPDEHMFLDRALETVGVEARRNATSGEKQQLFINMIERIEARVLLIDELHSILAGSITRQLYVLNILKYISNETGISIVAAGTQSAQDALAAEKELESRFPLRPLPRWSPDDDFRRLLSSFEAVLPLRNPSGLAGKRVADLIYGYSEGYIGGVASAIREAAVLAIKKSSEAITEDILLATEEVRAQRKRDAENL